MISFDKLRRLGPWLLGLFVIAHLAGVVPLLGTHVQHVFIGGHFAATQSTAIDHHNRHGAGAGHHHNTDTDRLDQCCAVHLLLTAVVPIESAANRNDSLGAPIPLLALSELVGTDATRLDRPPKLPLPV
jgi:hypothetical protein